MTTLYETLLPDGSKLWYASSVPTLSTDFPQGFVAGDLLQIVGGLQAGQMYVCTTGGAPGTWSAVTTGPSTRFGSQSSTQYFTGDQKIVSSTQGVDTAGVTTSIFVGAIYIPGPVTLTGIEYLIGSVGGTNHVCVILYSSTGAILAHSAVDASVVVGTTATVQQVPFTATYKITTAGLYFVGVSMDGNTAKLRTQFDGSEPSAIVTAQTFDALVAITPPTSFTTAQAPVAATY